MSEQMSAEVMELDDDDDGLSLSDWASMLETLDARKSRVLELCRAAVSLPSASEPDVISALLEHLGTLELGADRLPPLYLLDAMVQHDDRGTAFADALAERLPELLTLLAPFDLQDGNVIKRVVRVLRVWTGKDIVPLELIESSSVGTAMASQRFDGKRGRKADDPALKTMAEIEKQRYADKEKRMLETQVDQATDFNQMWCASVSAEASPAAMWPPSSHASSTAAPPLSDPEGEETAGAPMLEFATLPLSPVLTAESMGDRDASTIRMLEQGQCDPLLISPSSSPAPPYSTQPRHPRGKRERERDALSRREDGKRARVRNDRPHRRRLILILDVDDTLHPFRSVCDGSYIQSHASITPAQQTRLGRDLTSRRDSLTTELLAGSQSIGSSLQHVDETRDTSHRLHAAFQHAQSVYAQRRVSLMPERVRALLPSEDWHAVDEALNGWLSAAVDFLETARSAEPDVVLTVVGTDALADILSALVLFRMHRYIPVRQVYSASTEGRHACYSAITRQHAAGPGDDVLVVGARDGARVTADTMHLRFHQVRRSRDLLAVSKRLPVAGRRR